MHHPAAQHRLGLRRVSRHAYGLILALLAGLVLGAAPAPASAQPACGDVLTQSTTLTADLTCDGGFPALTIGAPRITLDLGGHTLSSFVAIVNEGHDDVTIRNGTIVNGFTSIRLTGVSGNLIQDIDSTGAVVGFIVIDSDRTRIVDNRLESISIGLSGSDRNVVARNVVTQFEGSIYLDDANHNRVFDNIVWAAQDGGFSLTRGSHHNVVRHNRFLSDTSYVMWLTDVNDNTLVDNVIASHGSVPAGAAQIEGSSRNTLLRNKAFGVTQGFRVQSGSANVFWRNDISGVPLRGTRPPYVTPPVPDGLLIDAAAAGTLIQANTVGGFDDDGIDVDAPGTRLKRNSANDNGDLGIEAVPGIIDLGGNSASGNGNPLQCLNVVCG